MKTRAKRGKISKYTRQYVEKGGEGEGRMNKKYTVTVGVKTEVEKEPEKKRG